MSRFVEGWGMGRWRAGQTADALHGTLLAVKLFHLLEKGPNHPMHRHLCSLVFPFRFSGSVIGMILKAPELYIGRFERNV